MFEKEYTLPEPSIISGRVAGAMAAAEADYGRGFIGEPNRPSASHVDLKLNQISNAWGRIISHLNALMSLKRFSEKPEFSTSTNFQ